MSDTSNVQDIILTAQAAIEPKELEAGTIYAVINDEGGVSVVDTMQYLPQPSMMRRSVKTEDAKSFIDYILVHQGDHKGEAVEIYSRQGSSAHNFVCVFDPNGWSRDRVSLQLQESPEWQAWVKRSGNLYDQIQFADFIEDQISTIVTPEGSTLLEIVQSMQANVKVAWKSAEWLANGQRSLLFDEQVDAKAGRTGKLEIPAQFTLALRPFLGSDPFEVKANLRYRIDGGHLTIGFKLIEPERRLEKAVEEVSIAIASKTGLEVWAGWPE